MANLVTWGVIGQERAVAVLQRAVEDPTRLSHAYLFAGPEHVGRAMAARAFAQAMNCELGAASASSRSRAFPGSAGPGGGEAGKPRLQEGDAVRDDVSVPCGACRTCRLIAEDKHPDIEWVRVGGMCDEPEHKDHENSRDIRICQVRHIERVVSRTTIDARYRLVIVKPADALTAEAANAFLKTLEEPAAHTVLVLITAREEALPETVRSRCRRIAFTGVPRAEIEAALQKRGADAARSGHLAGLAQGRLGWAIAALEDERLLAERERVLDEVESVLAGGYETRLKYAASLGARFSRDPETVRSSLDLWREWWRDVLLAAAGHEELASERGRLDTLRSQAAQYGVTGALQALRAVTDGRRHLEEHAGPTLAMEAMLLELPAPKGAGRS